MKTLRFIGMAILAVTLCANFTACSSDDEEEEAIIAPNPDNNDNNNNGDNNGNNNNTGNNENQNVTTLVGSTWKITSTDDNWINIGAILTFTAPRRLW